MNEQPVRDHQAIVQLTVDYCWALDSRDFERLRDVFLPDATAELGAGGQTGVEEIIDRVSTALARFDGTQHMVNTHDIDVAGETAIARCYLQAQHVRPTGETPALLTIGGRYEDRLRRTSDGWRIAHRALVTMWTAGR